MFRHGSGCAVGYEVLCQHVVHTHGKVTNEQGKLWLLLHARNTGCVGVEASPRLEVRCD